MAGHAAPNIVEDGLVFLVDAANPRSWTGPNSSTVNDLIGTDIKPIGSQTSPDVQSKYTTYGQSDDGNSVGWTQIRWNDRDESELLALEKIGITDPQQLMDPATSALATIAILYKEYQNQIPSKEKNNSAF